MDASAHKLHTIGVTDNAGDVPQSVRANAANAEQLALNRLFGLNLPATNNDQIGPQISRRIFGIVGGVHASMDEAGLSNLVTENVRIALQQVDPVHALGNNDQRRIQAVAKAAYESVPQDLLERFTLVTLPARISMDAEGRPSGFVEVRNVTIAGTTYTRLRVNMNAQFWKLNERTNATQDDIERRILNQTATELGIDTAGSVPNTLAPGFVFANAADITALASANDVRVTERPEGIGRAEYEYGTGTPRPRLNVNSDKMLSESTDADAPQGLQNRPIFTFSADEIQMLLEHRGKDGSYPYWKKYVTAGAGVTSPLNTLEDLTCNYPGLTPPVVIAPLGTPIPASEAASEIIRVIHRAPTRTDAVGTRQISMVQAQRDVHRKMNENREFIDRLRTGSENAQGAVVAASIALNDDRIFSSVTQNADEAKLKKEVTDSQKKQYINAELQKLRNLQISYKIQQLPGGVSPVSLSALESDLALLRADAGAVANGATLPATGISAFSASIGLAPSGTVATANRQSVSTQLQNFIKQIEGEIVTHEQCASMLRIIARDAVDADLYNSSGTLRRYVTNPTTLAIDRTVFNSDLAPVNIAEEIKKELKIESDDDLKSKIEKAEASLKKIKDGGDKGDVLQQKIFEAHFRNQGLSGQEAQRSANYLYAKSLVDNELRNQIDTLHDDLFADHDLHGALDGLNPAAALRRSKDWTVASNIARSVGMNPRYVPNSIVPFQGVTHYDWQSRSYPQLISAYYSFKKLYEGAGPDYCNSPGSSVYRDQMRNIAIALSDRHVTMLINDFGNDLPDKDRGDLGSRKTLSLELLEKMLTGEAPDKYRVRIDHILAQVDGATHRYRRALFGTTGALAGKTVSTLNGLASGTVNTTKAIGTGIWKQKKNIMGLAALTALGGPLGAAVFVGYKLWNAPKISTGGGGHH